MVREGHTRPRGPSESPDGVDPNIRRTRDNVTVITVGSKYEVYVRSPASSHMQTFRTLAIKWEVNMLLKKSSCVLSSCVCRLSCVCYHCVGMYPVYICMQQKDLCPIIWGCRIHQLLLCRGVRPPPNECPGYDTKQSDGEVPTVLELWGMRSTPSAIVPRSTLARSGSPW